MAIWRSLLLCLVLFSTAVSAQPAHNLSVQIETETRSPQPGGKATIASNGDMTIKGKPVTLTDSQRA